MPSSLASPLSRRLFGALAIMAPALLAPAVAHADFLDSINPSNWFADDKYETKVINDPPAGVLYQKGVTEMEKRDYDISAKTFSKLEKAYPYSQYQRKALIMTTYSQYSSKSYDDAIGSAKRYLGLYPNSPDSDYITYLEGMSYYDQIPDVNHDLARADKAIEAFNDVVKKYPASEYAADARYKIGVAKDQLAGKEMEVGRYYLFRHEYTAAVNRFRNVLAKYQTTPQTEEALERLTEAYHGAWACPRKPKPPPPCSATTIPNSPWYQDAFSQAARRQNLAPNEDKGSWISQDLQESGGWA